MPRGLCILVLVLVTSPLMAGMPIVTISDLWTMRLQSISFFLLLLLLSALGVMGLWNYLRRDFTALPRLTYLRSLSLVILLGLLFMVVLTMISGARELMTPGAWTKQGATYALNNPPVSEAARQERLTRLRDKLFQYADQHMADFPPHDLVPEIADEIWWLDDARTQRFLYIAGGKRGDSTRPIAYEPRQAGSKRLVLMGDGVLRWCTERELLQLMQGKS